MGKRTLLILLALVLLLGVALVILRVVGQRGGESPSPGPGGVGGGLPTAGERIIPSPAPSPGVLSQACPERWEGLADGDSDALPDEIEQLYLTDERNGDTDGDGYKDGEEIRAGYDPLKSTGNPQLDSDHDGLLDHEECRWKTDPFTPDTDGDGFEDGAEVSNLFDPTVKGDGKGSDALPERRARQVEQALGQFRPRADSDNLTERLAARILGERSSSEAANLSITQKDVERVLREFHLSLNMQLPVVDVVDLNISPSNTPGDIQTYLGSVDSLRPRDLDNPSLFVGVIGNAAGGDLSSLQNLRQRIGIYESGLRTTATPPSAVPHHRALIGYARFISDRLSVIELTTASDPVRAYVAARELEEGVRIHPPAILRFRDELERLGAPLS